MSRESSNPQDAGVEKTAAPERFVVEDPPPEPDYPRYRVEPGETFSLSDVDPDQTEHYRRKRTSRRSSRSSAVASGISRRACTPRTKKDCSSSCRRWTPGERTAP